MIFRTFIPIALISASFAANASAQIRINERIIDTGITGIRLALLPDEGPVVLTPFGEGGLRYSVRPSGFEGVANFVQQQGDRAVLPYDGRFRPGCFLSSPWLGVGHDHGFGQFMPEMSVDWTGILFPLTGRHAPILNLQVAIKAPDGSIRYERQVIDSGRLPSLIPIAQLDNGAVLYRGSFDNDVLNPRAQQGFEVNQGDEVQVSVCDLMGNTALTVRTLVFQSIPYQP
jgi:hypothetical protein